MERIKSVGQKNLKSTPLKICMKNNLTTKEIQKVLILVAMDCEEKSVLDDRQYVNVLLSERFALKGKKFEAEGKIFFAVKTGIGLANAASVTMLAIEFINPDLVIMLGVAGAIDPNLKIGEIVFAERVIQHDCFATFDKSVVQLNPGQCFLTEGDLPKVAGALTHQSFTRRLSRLVQNQNGLKSHVGVLLSGSEFVSSIPRKKELKARFSKGLAVDMETAAVLSVCEKSGISVIIAKSIADEFEPKEGIINQYVDFEVMASRNSAHVLDCFINLVSDNFISRYDQNVTETAEAYTGNYVGKIPV
jgi:adenosylhomocysteine nucleosidase